MNNRYDDRGGGFRHGCGRGGLEAAAGVEAGVEASEEVHPGDRKEKKNLKLTLTIRPCSQSHEVIDTEQLEKTLN